MRMNIVKTVVFVSKPAWHKATAEHISQYKEYLWCNLNRICLPVSALSCNDLMCGCSEHAELLNRYANIIMQCCVDAASSTIPLTSPKNCNKTLPGWTEYVAPVREKSVFLVRYMDGLRSTTLWSSCRHNA